MEHYLPSLSEPARRWLRLAGLLAALAALCWLAYALRAAFTPLLAAAAVAYVLNPVVTWIERTRRAQRLSIVIVVFAGFAAVVLGGGLCIGSRTVAQLSDMQERFPRYVQALGQWAEVIQRHLRGTSQPAAAETAAVAASQPAAVPAAPWWPAVAPLLEQHGIGVARAALGYLSRVASNALALVSLFVLVPVFTFYFLWRFNDGVRAIRDHLPLAQRDAIVSAVSTIDAAMANFFRGRLIVCLAVAALTGLGWTAVGVPFGLPLGLVAGALNLVPFLSLLVLPVALLAAYLGAMDAAVPWLTPVLLTMGVYMAVQTLESFLLSPWIEGKSSGLHPLLIVVALLIGAELAGLLGLLLAIPVASSLKTLAARLVLPEIRRLAGQPLTTTAYPAPGTTDVAAPPPAPTPAATPPAAKDEVAR